MRLVSLFAAVAFSCASGTGIAHAANRSVLTQGGFMVVAAPPGAKVKAVGVETVANADGYAFIGFDRDASPTQSIIIADSPASSVKLAPRTWRNRVVADLARAGPPPPPPPNDSEKKKRAFASRANVTGFSEVFAYPIGENGKAPRLSGMFGDNRVYQIIGKPDRKQPHFGVDIVAPVGTIVRAPASGIVVLADELNLEGKTVFIDHGQGLITMYLHLSDIGVKAGALVKKGDVLGKVGMTGRTNGAHLCWRAKWRGQNLDPTCLTGACAVPPSDFGRTASDNEIFDAGEIE